MLRTQETDRAQRVDSALAEFSRLYPKGSDYLEVLCADDGAMRKACPLCGCRSLTRRPHMRFAKCPRCKEQIWWTAGTFFERIRCPRAWLAAIWLRERGIPISVSRFHKFAEVAYSTAFNIWKKLSLICSEEMVENANIYSSRLFSEIIYRRSSQTPKGKHPREEEPETEGARPEENVRDSNQSSESQDATELPEQLELTPVEHEVYSKLQAEPVHHEVLVASTRLSTGQLSAVITLLELKGLLKAVVGNRYLRLASPGDERVAQHCRQPSRKTDDSPPCIGAFTAFIERNFQGISRKYLQLYLAEYWCYKDRIRWGPGSILQACLRSKGLSHADIRSYVTPPMVRLIS
jgi:hypothetical protein